MRDSKADTFIGEGELRLRDLTKDAGDECINWEGACQQDGVPVMKFRGMRVIPVRRLVYAWKRLGFPSMPWYGKHTRTTCGNIKCVNPNHVVESGHE